MNRTERKAELERKKIPPGFPILPEIPDVILIRHKGILKGSIDVGEVFAWEPDLPYARELLIVSQIVDEPNSERLIFTWDMDYRKRVFNDESRFREACVRTRFKRFPPNPLPRDQVMPSLKFFEKFKTNSSQETI